MQFNILLFLVIFTCTSTKCDNRNDNNGFVFTVPKTLRSGRRETACLSLHPNKTSANIRANVSISIETTGEQRSYAVTKKTIDSENVGCFEIRVPETIDTKAMLHLQVKFPETSSNYSINTIDTVNIIPNIGFTFVQTDKEMYKPGDRVKIRILILNQDLAVPKNLVIPTVKIRNPIRIAIGQWENVTTELGLVQLEHQLAQETVLGTWVIELPGNNGTFKTFMVKEYIPPRFEVQIKNPDLIYIKAKSFNLTVCGKYTYGLAVKGTAHIRLTLSSTDISINEMKQLENGCAEFEVKLKEIISQYSQPELYQNFHIIATVTDQISNTIETSETDIKISLEKYILEFVNAPTYFQKGMPYKGQIRVVDSFEDLTNVTVKICYNFAINQSWNLTEEQCGFFKLNEQNMTSFVVFPFEDSIHTIRFQAIIHEEKPDNVYMSLSTFPVYLSATLWYSPSSSYIEISQDFSATPIKCKAWQPFTILYTLNNTSDKEELIEFNYLIKSKGNIVKFGKMSHTPCASHPFDENDYKNRISNTTNLKPSLPIDKFILTVKIPQKMYSESQLIVYYTRNDGEIVAASIHFQVENCLANKVEANWSTNQNYPGESIYYKVKAAAGSICAISAIDKSTSIRNQPVQLTTDQLLKHIRKPKYYDSETSNKCKTNLFINAHDGQTIPYWDLRRKKRFFEYMSQFYDTLQVFNDAEILVMSDLTLVTRPCFNPNEYNMYNPVPLPVFLDGSNSPAPYQTQVTDMGSTIRSFFPETWLWDLVPIGRSGETQLKRNLPHSITQWIGNTFCVSPSAGIGIAQTTYITSFKPFFVDLLTPYAIKRHEVSHLPIIVFNYLNHSLPVKVTLTLSENLRLAGSPDESVITACVEPNDSMKDMFRVSALTLGKVNVSITAEVDSAYPGECGPEILLNRKDTIIKTILVQSEGFPFESIKSTFICMDNETNDKSNDSRKEIKWNVELPYDAVANSSRIKILLDTDLLELTTENLGFLLEIPTGCGEQIMAKLAPNLYVLRYLNATGTLTNYTRIKALNNIRIGYEQILQYKHSDGSFSAFGERLTNSSTFLTAFVIRTLSHASKYVYIDQNIIRNAVTWILNKQIENGCFSDQSFVFQRGMVNDDDDDNDDNSALTAYVLISLIESGVKIPENIHNNAKYCLRAHNSLNKYSTSIITYALTLSNWHEDAEKSLERLLEIASRENSLVWWEDSESLPSSLEMTSYVIMSLINLNSSDHIALANGAVRWLLTKRNQFGGFISTQDTVVALDALTKFALATKRENVNLTITISSSGKHYNFRITNKAKLKTKQLLLTRFSNFLKFKINGTGCILLQSVLRYNMPEILGNEAFRLQVTLSPISTIDPYGMLRLVPCMSHITPNKHANMVVMEVTLPSGYKPDRTSLFDLTRKSGLNVKKFEEHDDKVIFYFTKMGSDNICTPFLIREQNVIENRTDAIVRLYDYYNPEISTSTSYRLPNQVTNNITHLSGLNETEPINAYQQDSIDNIIENNPNQKSLATELNPDFVDLDIDLEYPDGIEGPEPAYIKPNITKE